MVTIRYHESKGWHDARIEPRAPIPMDPAAAVLHYAQEVFEGLKAYRTKDGGATHVPPDRECAALPAVGRAAGHAGPAGRALPRGRATSWSSIDRDWIPDGDGSLYLRPFMFANEIFLGVKPSSDYLFIVIASSVGSYFKTDAPAVSLWVSQEFTRAAPGGTGAAKCGGNYAASLLAQAEATRHGCDQVVFLDAVEQQWVEELGGMNIFFVFDDGSMVTPPLGGTILPGITRSSLLTLAKDKGIKVREDRYSIDQWRSDAAAAACARPSPAAPPPWSRRSAPSAARTASSRSATAAPAPSTEELKSALVGIQRGHAADTYGWIHKVF